MLVNNIRGKGIYNTDYVIKDCYKQFKKDNVALKRKVTYSLFMKIYKLFIKKVIYNIIEESADFKMFSRLGEISIKKKKIRKKLDEEGNIIHINRPPDWGSTNKMWIKKYGTADKNELSKIPNKKIIRFDNKNTNGYTLKICWDKSICNVKNQFKYVFKPTRDFARAIPLIRNDKNIDYYEY